MKKTITLAAAALLCMSFAKAQDRAAPVGVKMLTPAECALVTRRPEGDFFVKGTLRIGVTTISNSTVSANGIVIGGIDNFDVINRSCFIGKPG